MNFTTVYLFTTVDSSKIDVEASIDSKTMANLKELGLFGLQIPAEYGGLNFNATEYSKIMELVSVDGSIALMLSAHQAIGLRVRILKV